jgi:hypothetical protein
MSHFERMPWSRCEFSSQVDGMKKRITTAGKAVKARARGSLHLKRSTASKPIATSFSASKEEAENRDAASHG